MPPGKSAGCGWVYRVILMWQQAQESPEQRVPFGRDRLECGPNHAVAGTIESDRHGLPMINDLCNPCDGDRDPMTEQSSQSRRQALLTLAKA